LVDPLTAAIANGRSPAARSRATASATVSPCRRNRSSEATIVNDSGGNPSTSSARAIEKCAWSLA
jgi:hypothetical protein